MKLSDLEKKQKTLKLIKNKTTNQINFSLKQRAFKRGPPIGDRRLNRYEMISISKSLSYCEKLTLKH